MFDSLKQSVVEQSFHELNDILKDFDDDIQVILDELLSC